QEELAEIARICHENGVLVVSDEIHADLTLPGYTHHPFPTVSEEARMNSVVFMSPSKAFNMAGLSSSYCIIENEELRKQFDTHIHTSELAGGHVFAFTTVAAAYSNGTDWLNQMLDYVQKNIDFVHEYLQTHIPAIKIIRPQASYLIFLDCRELGMTQEELVHFFANGARLALNDGSIFGKEGTGFMRLNVGCPQSVLKQAMEQLHEAYNHLEQK
ncbi:aminotransferase class I/II-fold pyridoxal phosphate-dependent enzyme, partial [Bacteroides sp. OttesenSCG-928-D19]|nr:aminotransferase class I/II-fold pyridoxal phosphate-dependent enzyme [Bacteroides sp. OttesenSCG-928-D19]